MIWYQDAFLPVLFGQEGIFQPLYVAKGLFGTDRNKLSLKLLVFWDCPEFKLPISHTLDRKPDLQSVPISVWDAKAKIRLTATTCCQDLIPNLSGKTAAAADMVI